MYSSVPVLLFVFHRDPARKLSGNLYDIYHCCVYSEKTPDDGQRNSLKHVEFYFKNKFEELVHLVGFIIGIYHDAWSPERQSTVLVKVLFERPSLPHISIIIHYSGTTPLATIHDYYCFCSSYLIL